VHSWGLWRGAYIPKGKSMSEDLSKLPRDEERLTGPARDAIRGYMLRLVALPAALLAIISGIGGFFLNKVAFQEGYSEGYKAVSRDILVTAREVGEAKGKADAAMEQLRDAISKGQDSIALHLRDSTKASAEAKAAAEEARKTSESAQQMLTRDLDRLAAELANTKSFRDAATSVTLPSFGDLRRDVTSIASKLETIRFDCKTEIVHSPASNNFTTSIPTPLGYKLVGGSCAFDDWRPGDNPTMIQVGPPDNSGKAWSCYAKQPRPVTFTTTATFCRMANGEGK
jgi:hypothetical protein